MPEGVDRQAAHVSRQYSHQRAGQSRRPGDGHRDDTCRVTDPRQNASELKLRSNAGHDRAMLQLLMIVGRGLTSGPQRR